jgi:hypothetical protein
MTILRLIAALAAGVLACTSCGGGGTSSDARDPGQAGPEVREQAAEPDVREQAGEPDEGSSVVPTPEGLAAAVDRERLAADLDFLAKPRAPGSAHWQAVQDRCAEVFAGLGFEVERQEFQGGVNVIGVRAGASLPSERLVVSAHYDHIAGCDGADDNASGVAGVFEAARVLSAARFERTLVVACWDQEEIGLQGSRAYANRAAQNGEAIQAAYVFEMIGYASSAPNSQQLPPGLDVIFKTQADQLKANDLRGDFVAVIADENALEAALPLEAHALAIGLPNIRLELKQNQLHSPVFGTLQRSDHAAFWWAGFPAMMITDTSEYRNRNYHCAEGPDGLDRLDLEYATQVVRATVYAVATRLGVAPL